MNTPIKRLFICATSVMALASCGGGNDVASGGAGTGVTSASAVTAGAPSGAAANSATSTSVTSTKAAMDRVGSSGTIPDWVNGALQQVFAAAGNSFSPAMAGIYSNTALSQAFLNNGFFAPNQSTMQQVYNITAFLANSAHETGNNVPDASWPTQLSWPEPGWQYFTERNAGPSGGNAWWTDGVGNFGGSLSACQTSYPSNPGTNGQPPPVAPTSNCYFGRGAMQLTWNYNYYIYDQTSGGNIASGVFMEPNKIYQVTQSLPNGLAWDSGVWFWSTLSCGLNINSTTCDPSNSARPMTAFQVDPSIYSTTDPFGASIKTINGSLECLPTQSAGPTYAQDRIKRFVNYLPIVAKAAGVTPLTNYSTVANVGLTCTAGTSPPSSTGTITINFNNTGTAPMQVTLADKAFAWYDYSGLPLGTTVYTSGSGPRNSSNLANEFPDTTSRLVSVYLNRNGSNTTPVSCSANMAASAAGNTYTIDFSGAGCSVSGPTALGGIGKK